MIKDLLYCPLDLPAPPKDISLDNFLSFDTFKGPQKDLQNEKHSWRMLMLRRALIDGISSFENQLDFKLPWEWKPEIIKRAPNLIKWAEQNLPFKKITFVAMLCSRKAIAPHTDVPPHRHGDPINDFYRNWNPSMFRFLIDGDMVQNGFFVVQKGKKIYTALPKLSPGWAMNFDCIHGNDDPVPERKLLLYVMGEIDESKHNDLLQRSLKKYQSYAIMA